MTDNNPHATWTKELFDIFGQAGITLYPFIPDAGNKRLIELAEAANDADARWLEFTVKPAVKTMGWLPAGMAPERMIVVISKV